MTRLLLRTLNAPVLILLTMIGVAIQTSIFTTYPLNYFQPDIILLVVIWCALKRDFTEGGIITLILGNIGEVHSSTPQGLFLISYMLIFLLVRSSSKLFMMPNLSSIVTLTLGALVFLKLSNLAILSLLGASNHQWRHSLALILTVAAAECIVAIWIYRWLERFDWLTYKNARAEHTHDEELQPENLE